MSKWMLRLNMLKNIIWNKNIHEAKVFILYLNIEIKPALLKFGNFE